MAFIQALSGLYGAATGLDVIGNNLANASTVGYKNSRAEFSDIFNSYLKAGVGGGALSPGVAQQFTQGSLASTNNGLDFSINGNGMFQVVSDTTATASVAYTRNGEFHFSPVPTAAGTAPAEKYIVNANGSYLTGWAEGVATTTAPSALKLIDSIAAKQTTTSNLRFNLDDRASVPTDPVFSPNSPASFNWSSSQEVFSGVNGDTKAHALTLYFVKTATPNTWEVHTRIDGAVPAEEAGGPRQLVFSPTGSLLSGGNITSSGPVTAESKATDPVTGAVTLTSSTVTLPISIDFGQTTLFASGFDSGKSLQDGYKDGLLAGTSLSTDGTIQGRYSNGQTQNMGKVALATFINPNGLQSIGSNLWRETSHSGAANIGSAAQGGRGVTASNSLEQANIDTAAQLVDMITMQRNYQANAQTIKTQDDMLKTLTGLR
ncbi:flagellar hook-basal body complex protein [Dechloromonas sp. TW-R-39-2]|uniref:flagellar hook protein FlgE n=1 Tax=Dechloromonas sp. TW-R-39-2 TaxID=2654218 RepID=UPI00193E3240|nr:flagellar hook protein FlgE [Dechloromonas sp. TW-R-39-2]QRM20505.1 flagellar hook-basal body complex protein [Dechloromonas sp. TW-R-39-2]